VGYNHTTNIIDAKNVETSQRGVLGRFYKRLCFTTKRRRISAW
jgi:hypothetical protein